MNFLFDFLTFVAGYLEEFPLGLSSLIDILSERLVQYKIVSLRPSSSEISAVQEGLILFESNLCEFLFGAALFRRRFCFEFALCEYHLLVGGSSSFSIISS
jgi:hypothetical protein